MIDREAREIIKQYEKHGWALRRVLLCRPEDFSSLENPFGDAVVINAASEINALWFSRRAPDGREAWELRRLSGAPFALVEIFADGETEAAREKILRRAEEKMRDR
jgi:hypothetical protein